MSIQQDRFFVNDTVTHGGTPAEGLLLNSRMVQAAFDDENASTRGHWKYPDTGIWDPDRNTDEFIAALPGYRARGLLAFTINLQGGATGVYMGDAQPPITTAFTSTGALKAAWMSRIDRIIRAADQQGMVVIVGLFYFGQDHRLANESAVVRAVDNATDWLLASGYRNVLIEVNNECNIRYDHPILQCNRVAELIDRVRQRSGGTLPVSTSFAGGKTPSDAVISASDYVLVHGNSLDSAGVVKLIGDVRALASYQTNPKPIIFNEDSTAIANFDAAVSHGTSWGYYDQGRNNYHDGFQSPPVNWTINTGAKRAFFDRVAAWTDTSTSRSSGSARVTSLTLINAETNLPVAGYDPLPAGATLNLAMLPTRRLNIRANTNPFTVGSVQCHLNGKLTLTENVAPYACWGDTNGNYVAWTPTLGTHTLMATPYSTSGAGGVAGTSLTQSFHVIDQLSSDTEAPVITMPPPGAITIRYSGSVMATDASPIVRVEVWLNAQLVKTCSSVPCLYEVELAPLPPGDYVLATRVSDSLGNVSVASHTIRR